MTDPRWLHLFGLTCAAIAGAVLGCAPATPPATTAGASPVAAVPTSDGPGAAPTGPTVSLALPDDAGNLVTVPVPGARATVLDLWAPSCAPCAKTLPALVAREAELTQKGAKLLLVGILEDEESTDLARQTLASWGVTHGFLIERGDATRAQVGARSLPATAIVDAGGRLVWLAHEETTPDAVIRAVP